MQEGLCQKRFKSIAGYVKYLNPIISPFRLFFTTFHNSHSESVSNSWFLLMNRFWDTCQDTFPAVAKSAAESCTNLKFNMRVKCCQNQLFGNSYCRALWIMNVTNSYQPISQVHLSGSVQFPWTQVSPLKSQNGTLQASFSLDQPGRQMTVPCWSQM